MNDETREERIERAGREGVQAILETLKEIDPTITGVSGTLNIDSGGAASASEETGDDDHD